MESGALSAKRSLPRWMRRFAVAARRANIFVWLEGVSGVTLAVAVLTTWLAFSNAPGEGTLLSPAQVSFL